MKLLDRKNTNTDKFLTHTVHLTSKHVALISQPASSKDGQTLTTTERNQLLLHSFQLSGTAVHLLAQVANRGLALDVTRSRSPTPQPAFRSPVRTLRPELESDHSDGFRGYH